MQKPSSMTRRNLLAAGLVAILAPRGARATTTEPTKLDLASYGKIPAQKFAWGWIRWLMNAQLDPQATMTVGIVQIAARQPNPLHKHPNSDEILHVLSGSCEHRIGDNWQKLFAGDTIRIPQGMPHMARAGDTGVLSMVIYNTGKREMIPVNDDSVTAKTSNKPE